MKEHNDINVLNKQYKSPIKFLGKTRELKKTTKRVSNELIFLLKRELQIGRIIDPEEYKKEMDKWLLDAQKLVKSIIAPISDEELEYIDEDSLEIILETIERRKKIARGFTNEDIDKIESANRKSLVDNATLMLDNTGDNSEDFPKTDTTSDQGTSTGKPNTSEE